MKRFRSDASDCFYLQGTEKVGGDEVVVWGPGEPLHEFAERMAAVYADLEAEFLPKPETLPSPSFSAS
ncbi:hypothetical protein D3C71_1777820 [compost metagenome]